jgi:RNase adapter protein RapZ
MTEFAVIAGLSGAGCSTAGDVLEDLGWFVIDNLPSALVAKMVELAATPDSAHSKVALVVRPSEEGEEAAALPLLRQAGSSARVVFLEARTDVLVRRYESSRRRHPEGAHGQLVEAIERERTRLAALKAEADVIVDTSDINVHQLRDRITELFSEDGAAARMQTRVISFGFKHGLPVDVDLVLDCRFLPNPHWVEALRPQTGLDGPVRDYVLAQPATGEFLERLDDLLVTLLPAYAAEGKSYLSIALGCTGGRHRSVVIAEQIAERLRTHGYEPGVAHRDIGKP